MSIKSKCGNLFLLLLIFLVYRQYQFQQDYDLKLETKLQDKLHRLREKFNLTELERNVAGNFTKLKPTKM